MIHCVTGAGECRGFVTCDDAEAGAYDTGYNLAYSGFSPGASGSQPKCSKDNLNVTHVVKMIDCVVGSGACKGFIQCDDGLVGVYDEGYAAGFALACTEAGGTVSDGACAGLTQEYECDEAGNAILTLDIDMGIEEFSSISAYIYEEKAEGESLWAGYLGNIYVSDYQGGSAYGYYADWTNAADHPDWNVSFGSNKTSLTFPLGFPNPDKKWFFQFSSWGTLPFPAAWNDGVDNITLSSNGTTIWTGSTKNYPCAGTSGSYYNCSEGGDSGSNGSAYLVPPVPCPAD